MGLYSTCDATDMLLTNVYEAQNGHLYSGSQNIILPIVYLFLTVTFDGLVGVLTTLVRTMPGSVHSTWPSSTPLVLLIAEFLRAFPTSNLAPRFNTFLLLLLWLLHYAGLLCYYQMAIFKSKIKQWLVRLRPVIKVNPVLALWTERPGFSTSPWKLMG